MRHKYYSALLPLLTLLTFGCLPAPESRSRPEDFSLTYNWQAGTMPPPYHYQYEIQISPGPTGRIIFQPDYDFNEPPVWTEELEIEESDLDKLYQLLVDKRFFQRRLRPSENPPIGGSTRWMAVTAHGDSYAVPDFVENEEEARALAEIYAAIEAMVPQPLWERLYDQQAEYEETFLQNEE